MFLLLLFACNNTEVENSLIDMEKRLTTLEAQVLSLQNSHTKHVLNTNQISINEKNELSPILSEDDALKCVYQIVEGVATAQKAYDAAFDKWGTTLDEIGFDVSYACSKRVAVWIDGGSRTYALIHNGPGEGRYFVHDLQNPPKELSKLNEEKIRSFLKKAY